MMTLAFFEAQSLLDLAPVMVGVLIIVAFGLTLAVLIKQLFGHGEAFATQREVDALRKEFDDFRRSIESKLGEISLDLKANNTAGEIRAEKIHNRINELVKELGQTQGELQSNSRRQRQN